MNKDKNLHSISKNCSNVVLQNKKQHITFFLSKTNITNKFKYYNFYILNKSETVTSTFTVSYFIRFKLNKGLYIIYLMLL